MSEYEKNKDIFLYDKILLYVKALLIYFSPPICLVAFVHYTHLVLSVKIMPFIIAFGFPIIVIITPILYNLILKSEPIIYSLPIRTENLKAIFINIALEMLVIAVAYFIILQLLGIEKINNRNINILLTVGFFLTNYLIMDFVIYANHIVLHKSKLLYRYIHRYHHEALVTSIFTFHRLHLSEYIVPITFIVLYNVGIGYLFNILGINILNEEFYSWILGQMLAFWQIEYFGLVGHSNREFIAYHIHNWFPFNMLGTVSMHAIHHARIKCNYGAFFKIWDIIFGTFSTDHSLVIRRVNQNKPLKKLAETLE